MRADWVKTTLERLGHIKVLSLDDIRALPVCGPYEAGIYFLWLKDELQYVGKSKQVSERIAQQGRALRHNALTAGRRGIPHDRHTCLPVDEGTGFEWRLAGSGAHLHRHLSPTFQHGGRLCVYFLNSTRRVKSHDANCSRLRGSSRRSSAPCSRTRLTAQRQRRCETGEPLRHRQPGGAPTNTRPQLDAA